MVGKLLAPKQSPNMYKGGESPLLASPTIPEDNTRMEKGLSKLLSIICAFESLFQMV